MLPICVSCLRRLMPACLDMKSGYPPTALQQRRQSAKMMLCISYRGHSNAPFASHGAVTGSDGGGLMPNSSFLHWAPYYLPMDAARMATYRREIGLHGNHGFVSKLEPRRKEGANHDPTSRPDTSRESRPSQPTRACAGDSRCANSACSPASASLSRQPRPSQSGPNSRGKRAAGTSARWQRQP